MGHVVKVKTLDGTRECIVDDAVWAVLNESEPGDIVGNNDVLSLDFYTNETVTLDVEAPARDGAAALMSERPHGAMGKTRWSGPAHATPRQSADGWYKRDAARKSGVTVKARMTQSERAAYLAADALPSALDTTQPGIMGGSIEALPDVLDKRLKRRVASPRTFNVNPRPSRRPQTQAQIARRVAMRAQTVEAQRVAGELAHKAITDAQRARWNTLANESRKAALARNARENGRKGGIKSGQTRGTAAAIDALADAAKAAANIVW